MDIISPIAELRTRLSNAGRIAFVPTMGNLHAGHLALVRMARERGDCVVASLFVNPLQFGQGEDFAAYPRSLEQDCTQLAATGCDVVFTPDEAALYPEPQMVHVEPAAIANDLCGAYRPGHFRGVCTVVAKLFNIVQPQVAVFGKKDYQQLHIIRQMTRQLDFSIEIAAGETVREADGLAMSSRNGYLTPQQRHEAPRLYRTLQQVVQDCRQGRRDFAAIEAKALPDLTGFGWQVDYIELRSAHTLNKPTQSEGALVALGAARLGRTRLIDNIEFEL